MESEEIARHRSTGLSHHPWNAEEDAFLAFMVAFGFSVAGIQEKFKTLFKVDLRENQITGRTAEVKKSTNFFDFPSFLNNSVLEFREI